MESFVKAVMNHIIEEKLLASKQYGFISRRSTTTQLLRYLDKCIETIVDTIYLDLAKAGFFLYLYLLSLLHTIKNQINTN